MSYIRWSTKLSNKHLSGIYSWTDVDGGVYICSNEKSQKKVKNQTGTFSGGTQIRLTPAEMLHMCESYIAQNKPKE